MAAEIDGWGKVTGGWRGKRGREGTRGGGGKAGRESVVCERLDGKEDD